MVGIQTNMDENEIDRMIVRRFIDLRESLPNLTWDQIILVGLNAYEKMIENLEIKLLEDD